MKTYPQHAQLIKDLPTFAYIGTPEAVRADANQKHKEQLCVQEQKVGSGRRLLELLVLHVLFKATITHNYTPSWPPALSKSWTS